MVTFPAAYFSIRLTPKKDVVVLAIVYRRREGQKRIHTYIEAVNYVLSLHAAHGVVAKPALKIESFK